MLELMYQLFPREIVFYLHLKGFLILFSNKVKFLLFSFIYLFIFFLFSFDKLGFPFPN